jgi:hypothetical protein
MLGFGMHKKDAATSSTEASPARGTKINDNYL